ncbi:MAG TPA: hypothetical protein DHW71_08625 [Gammaproteobacteria bacterium]|nr:hypothetical protein [Gammaproteobacteria bacterium]HBF06667.1 hypothetical protein [Gammaproteobacteria bacterium]HCK93037.1 hypothetical protein [Gammaproteobacteria bacterium]|tara:strand:- start:1954 stop:2952 length:999 start_codon:yes stop_codon:yes gene_type:complete
MNHQELMIQRRKIVKRIAMAAAASPFVGLLGCGGDANDAVTSIIGDGTSNSGTTTPMSGSSWLSGGTSSMEATFPPTTDPFSSGLGNLCTLTEEFTIGPCYFNVEDTRDDISEGQQGIPMTLAMKVVDANCNPIEGAVVEVWWCDYRGIYSADTSETTTEVSDSMGGGEMPADMGEPPEMVEGEMPEGMERGMGGIGGDSGSPTFQTAFCSGNDELALVSRFFRGVKTSDANGNVYLKGCFPGWYASRTTHIHTRVVLDGTQQLISQFGFDDEMANDIYLNHPDYTGIAKDTSNSTDTVFPSDAYLDYLFEVEQLWDGSMLAYKAIQIQQYG